MNEPKNLESLQLSKPTPKLDKIVRWLRENPELVELPNRVIAQKIGDVSHTLVKQAKDQLQ